MTPEQQQLRQAAQDVIDMAECHGTVDLRLVRELRYALAATKPKQEHPALKAFRETYGVTADCLTNLDRKVAFAVWRAALEHATELASHTILAEGAVDTALRITDKLRKAAQETPKE